MAYKDLCSGAVSPTEEVVVSQGQDGHHKHSDKDLEASINDIQITLNVHKHILF